MDRFDLSADLGFSIPAPNSLDAVSDRDFACDFLYWAAMLGMHLSRCAEAMIVYSTMEYGYLTLSDEFSTGSSLMPQKKNPDVAELTRGKTGRVYGALTALLTTLKGLPLTYNRDLQEDKEGLFDAIDTVKIALATVTAMLATLKPDRKRMAEAASDPALEATDLAEWLVRHGVPFRTAHHEVGAFVAWCNDHGKTLDEATLGEMRETIPAATEECLGLFNPKASADARDIIGGTALAQVRQQVAFWKQRLQA